MVLGLIREGENYHFAERGENFWNGACPWTGSRERTEDSTVGLSKGVRFNGGICIGSRTHDSCRRFPQGEDFWGGQISRTLQGYSNGVQAARVEGSEISPGDRRSSRKNGDPTIRLDGWSVECCYATRGGARLGYLEKSIRQGSRGRDRGTMKFEWPMNKPQPSQVLKVDDPWGFSKVRKAESSGVPDF